VQADDSTAASSLVERLQAALADSAGVADAAVAQSEAQARALWALRSNISEAERLEGYSIKHDVSLPIGAFEAFLDQAGRALGAALPGARIVAFGHLGDGNLHYNVASPSGADSAAFVARASESANRIVHDLVHGLGGSISAEHGLGQLKREEIRR
jgi:FAD/FMN-containing dehydrogenase